MSTLYADCMSSFRKACSLADKALEDATCSLNSYQDLQVAIYEALKANTIEQKSKIVGKHNFQIESITDEELEAEFQSLINLIKRVQCHFDNMHLVGLVVKDEALKIDFEGLDNCMEIDDLAWCVKQWTKNAHQMIINLIFRLHNY